MNNKLIALAVAAAVSMPAIATAGPTFYGHMQVEIANVDNKGYGENNTKNRTGVAATESGMKVTDNKRGRLGIKGSEDLGGGLKAVYNFENQIDTSNGSLTDGARDSMIGLKGGFGEIQVGRLKSGYKYFGGVKYDAFVTTYMEARKSGGMVGGDFGQNGFWSDSIGYKNKFGAVSLWITYGLDEGDGASASTGSAVTTKPKGAESGDYSIAVKYKASNFEVIAATSSDTNKLNVSTAKDGVVNTKIGGQYKLGASTISAQYEMTDVETGDDSTVMFLGYQFKMGKNKFVAQYGQTDVDNGSTKDVTYLAAGVWHSFSKKTSAFVGYRNSDGDKDNDLTATSVGLRVKF